MTDAGSLAELLATGGLGAVAIFYLIGVDRDNRKRLAEMHEFYLKKLDDQRDSYKKECDERLTRLENAYSHGRN